MPILKVKNKETGQWEQVGVSTEATGAQIAAHNVAADAHADIRQAVTKVGTDLTAHNTSTSAHADIRQAVAKAGTDLTAHNVSTSAHADIRQAISQLSTNLASAQASNTKFTVSKTDLQDGVSKLANDTLYLVYE